MIRRSLAAAALALAAAACGSSGHSAGPAGLGARTPSAVPSPAVSPTPSPSPAPSVAPAAALPSGYDPARDAKADIAAAVERAKVDHHRVLLDLGADWCPDCRVLGTLYTDPAVRPFLTAHYDLALIDVGRFDRNLDVSKTYGNVIDNGIPALVVLDDQGHVVTTTRDGSFADARTMKPAELLAFLKRWAPTV